MAEENKNKLEAYCPLCGSSDIKIFDDGSGYCNLCKKAFFQYTTEKKNLDLENTVQHMIEEKKNSRIAEQKRSEPEHTKYNVSLFGYYLMILGAFTYLTIIIATNALSPGSDINAVKNWQNTLQTLALIQNFGIFLFLFGSAVSVKELLKK